MRVDKGLDGRGIYRAIYTSLWDDIDFRKLSPAEKLVFLNLRTSPLTNMPVIYPYYVEAIERQTGLDRDEILRALDTLSDSHWIAIQEGIVWVMRGLKFDPNIVLSNEKHLVAIKNIILALPKLQIVRDFIDFYKINIPYPIPSRIAYDIPHAIQDPDPDPEEEKEKEEESEGKPKVKPFSLCKGNDGDMPFRLPCRWKNVLHTIQSKKKRHTVRSDWEAMAKRIAWRQILRWVEAQLALVETGMVKIQEVFTPYLIVNKTKTLYEQLEATQFQIEYKK